MLGATYDVMLSEALPSTGAFLVSRLSRTTFQCTPLPAPLPKAPGCELLVALQATVFTVTSSAGTASYPVGLPASTSYLGTEFLLQWAVLDSANPLGIVVSNAGRAWLGL